jgi:hypothetical protein
MMDMQNICRTTRVNRSASGQHKYGTDAAQVLADEFLASQFNQPEYAHWPLDRQLHAFLAEGAASAVDDYEIAYTSLYAKVVAARRSSTSREPRVEGRTR